MSQTTELTYIVQTCLQKPIDRLHENGRPCHGAMGRTSISNYLITSYERLIGRCLLLYVSTKRYVVHDGHG